MKIDMLEKFFTKKSFCIISIFYLLFKLIPYTQTFSILTYVYSFFGLCVFAYNRLIRKIDLLFPGCYFSYGLITITAFSIIFNGNFTLKDLIISVIPIFINFFVIFPTNYDDTKEDFFNIFCIIMKMIFIIGVVVSLLNIIYYFYEFFIVNSVNEFIFQRMSGILGNPNIVGWFSAVFLGSVLFISNLECYNDVIYNKFATIALILATICVVFSQCRSVFFGIILYILYKLSVGIFNYCYKKYTIVALIIIAIVIAFALLFLYFSRPNLGSGRIEMYSFAIYEYINNNVVFGIGALKLKHTWVNDYYEYFNLSHNVEIPKIYLSGNPHNVLLEQLCVNGIIGFVIIIMFLRHIVKFIFHLINNYSIFENFEKKYIDIYIYYMLLGISIGMFENCLIMNMTTFVNFLFMFSVSCIYRF